MSIQTDDSGRILLSDGVTSGYAMNRGGWVEAAIRADTISHWEAAAESRNLLRRVTQGDGTETLVRAASDVHIDGPFYPVITPAALDDEGNVTTAAVTDSRPHYNLRIGRFSQQTMNTAGTMPRWLETLEIFMSGDEIPEADRNKSEDGLVLDGITILDPLTIATPQRVYS